MGTLMTRHAVFARLDDGDAIRVTPWRTWEGALARWQVLDDTRRRVEYRKDGWTNVKFFAVRANDDPQWNEMPLAPERVLATVGHGNHDDRPVLKRIGKMFGLTSREGGWIYRDGHALTQGWRSYRSQFQRQGRLVVRWFPEAEKWTDRTRYFQNAYDLDLSNDPTRRGYHDERDDDRETAREGTS